MSVVTSKLLAPQEVINAKDKVIIGLKAEPIKALGELTAKLRALSLLCLLDLHTFRAAEGKKAVVEKDCELKFRDS